MSISREGHTMEESPGIWRNFMAGLPRNAMEAKKCAREEGKHPETPTHAHKTTC